MKKIITLLVCLSTIFCFAQSYSKFLSKDVFNLNQERLSNPDRMIIVGEQILKVSKNEYDFSVGYFNIASGYGRKEDFAKAIFFAKKSDSILQKLNIEKERFSMNYLIGLGYKKTGLMPQAYEQLAKLKEMTRQFNKSDYYSKVLLFESLLLFDDKKYCEDIPIRKNIIKDYLSNIENAKKNKEPKNILTAMHMILSKQRAYLSFEFIACGDFISAKEQILYYEKMYEDEDTKPYLEEKFELYFLSKALIDAKENRISNAKANFDKAENAAEERKYKSIHLLILEQRLKARIDNNEEKNKLFDHFVQLKDSLKEQATQTISLESTIQNKKTESVRKSKNILLTVVGLLTFGIFTLVFFYRKKEKKNRKKFNDIIKKLEESLKKKKDFADIPNHPVNILPVNEISNKTDSRIMSEQKEAELLQNLNEFEKGKEFTVKNFTLSDLAHFLNTNTKYTNYLIKKYREKNFSDYINGLKIRYILEYIYENPVHLKYKIQHFSDLAGFSSSGYFAKIFMQETGLSPSKFISSLKKQPHSHDKSNS
ncbi:helix-turn-helix domain-containing protein [Chryseobacterium sp. MIQD13]|uniref:helix-turn-helix domain-containing protein n=1 Tax=Chryseobacterium sp. MIQD13 TaxID=3422310 RepID=UPI003D2E1A4A